MKLSQNMSPHNVHKNQLEHTVVKIISNVLKMADYKKNTLVLKI